MTMKIADLCNTLPSELSNQLGGDNVVSSQFVKNATGYMTDYIFSFWG